MFEFNVLVLGDAKVGKTSLIQTIVKGGTDLVHTRDSEQMYEMLNMHKSTPTRELWKHKVEISDGSEITVKFHDTQSPRYDASIKQMYRDMHGFIIVCDITNLQSLRDVPQWIK